jgi:hypothetical protein
VVSAQYWRKNYVPIQKNYDHVVLHAQMGTRN